MNLTIGSLCTGYGGLDLAVQQVFGGELAFVADNDPHASRLLAHHHPDVPNLGDITTYTWLAPYHVDVLTAGYPCQPFSHAGQRKGTDDERHLWPHIRDAIGVLRPRLVVLENVAGHVSLGAAAVVADLAGLGYDARWTVVRAADVGACHRRSRWFCAATDTSEIVVACTSRTRYFDGDAVRGGAENVKDQRVRTTNGPKQDADRAEVLTANYSQRIPSHPGGAPLLDWWKIPTRGYPGSHYATFPPALVEPLVKAMCPPRVCLECGQPSRRITEPTPEHAATLSKDMFGQHHNDVMRRTSGKSRGDGKGNARITADNITVGWSDCGHDAWRTGVVLDPFAGSGTTLQVAVGHGHDAIGIDLDERNADLAYGRLGMFLHVENQDRPTVDTGPL